MKRLPALIVTAALMALAAAAPAVAAEEAGTIMDNALVPVAPSAGKGGATKLGPEQGGAATTQAWGDTFACNQPYSIVQAKPSGYVVGNCLSGTHLRRQDKSSPYSTSFPSAYWDGGWIFGNYNGCGWINSGFTNLAGSTTQSLCPVGSIGYNNSEYQTANNNGACAPSTCTDGTAVRLRVNCNAWGNFRPWAPGQMVTDFIRVVPAGTTLYWRYMTKYEYPAGSGEYMVMARDPSYSAGNGNWAFYHSPCFEYLTGYNTNVG